MGFRINLSNETKDTIDRPLYLPEGWFHVTLSDAFEGESEQDLGKQVLEFTVTDGKHAGQKYTERLTNPDDAPSEESQEMAMRRMKIFVSRMGLVSDADFGKEDVEIDFTNAIGKEFAIQIKNREYIDKRTGTKKETTSMPFGGIHPWGSDGIPSEGRKALGLPPLSGHDTTTTKPRGGRGPAKGHPDAGSGKPHKCVDTSDL